MNMIFDLLYLKCLVYEFTFLKSGDEIALTLMKHEKTVLSCQTIARF